MISNSLDIDFIYGDIHGRSCKNLWFIELLLTEPFEKIVKFE